MGRKRKLKRWAKDLSNSLLTEFDRQFNREPQEGDDIEVVDLDDIGLHVMVLMIDAGVGIPFALVDQKGVVMSMESHGLGGKLFDIESLRFV